MVMCTEDVTFPTSEDCTYLETMGVGMFTVASHLWYISVPLCEISYTMHGIAMGVGMFTVASHLW